MVGIGPGGPGDRTRRAEQAIEQSGVVVGYTRYLKLIEDLTHGKEIISSGMTQEVVRCKAALERAAGGAVVALVSSGDAGIYGMAGLAMELAQETGNHAPIEVVPGVTASSAAAAVLGAPLMLDYAVISLSDLLIPWVTVKARLEAVAAADLVVALYNPRSRKRTQQIEEAAKIFKRYRSGATPVGIATSVGKEDESAVVSDLDHFLDCEINMRSVVIVGNSTSRLVDGRIVTPRGYGVGVGER
ncbi:MAG: precorrin-3B C(17)-methyltransferase [Pseudomonadota bacterium]